MLQSKSFASRFVIAMFAVMLAASPALAKNNKDECKEPRQVADKPATVLSSWQTGNTKKLRIGYAQGVVYASGDKTMEAWDVTSGKLLWRQDLKMPAGFYPRAVDGVAISSGKDHIAAWDAKTGAPLWAHWTAEEPEIGVPLMHDGKVYFGADSELKAVDAKTGEELWSFAVTYPRLIYYAPTVSNDGKTILLGPGDGILYGIDAESGELMWLNDTDKQRWQYLRQLYVSDDGTLVAGGYKDDVYMIDASNGEVLHRKYGGNFINSHLVSGDTAYFWSPTGNIYSLDVDTNGYDWCHMTNEYSPASKRKTWGPLMAELKADDTHLYALDMRSTVHVLSKANGNEIAGYQLPFTSRFVIELETGTNRGFVTNDKTGEIVHIAFD